MLVLDLESRKALPCSVRMCTQQPLRTDFDVYSSNVYTVYTQLPGTRRQYNQGRTIHRKNIKY